MNRQRSGFAAILMVVASALLMVTPAFSAGFGIFEQGSKAMGMAGAFTAQADDPSAMFHNVGGLAFFDEREFQIGLTFITGENDFKGAEPFPGSGVTEEQETLSEIPPHFYYVQPIGERLNFGLSINSPFGLTTDWANKDSFTGRFISEKASLVTIDITPNIGWQVSEKFGLGFGLIIRSAQVELNRRSAVINPGNLQPVDVAQVKLESDMDQGLGFQAGILHRFTNHFSWGLSVRSPIKVEWGGDGVLTQIPTGNPALDGVVGATLPFGSSLPLETELEFPPMGSLGLAVQTTNKLLIEFDANFTGWSSVDKVFLDFQNDTLDSTIELNYEDAMNYRLGFKYTASATSEWRFGLVRDFTPQPSSSVGPLLPDADRNGLTAGYGRTGSKLNWDIALMYLPFKERTTLSNQDGYNGTYDTTAFLLGGTVGW